MILFIVKHIAITLHPSLSRSGVSKKIGDSRLFYGLHADYPSVAVVSLGKKDVGYNEQEELDEGRENIRVAVGGR